MFTWRLLDQMGTRGIERDRQIPDHRFDVDVGGGLPLVRALGRPPHQILRCRGHELEMQLPSDLRAVRDERGGDVQRHGQDHLRLAQSQAHLVVLVKRDRLRLGHDRVFVGRGWNLVENLLAAQGHGVLDAGDDATGKVQRSYDILAQLISRLEQAEPPHDAPLVRNQIVVGPPARRYVLQVMEGDLELRLRRFLLQKGIRWR